MRSRRLGFFETAEAPCHEVVRITAWGGLTLVLSCGDGLWKPTRAHNHSVAVFEGFVFKHGPGRPPHTQGLSETRGAKATRHRPRLHHNAAVFHHLISMKSSISYSAIIDEDCLAPGFTAR